MKAAVMMLSGGIDSTALAYRPRSEGHFDSRFAIWAYDWGFQPKADRRQIEAPATCHYSREKTNELF